jgi:hypothetical protein
LAPRAERQARGAASLSAAPGASYFVYRDNKLCEIARLLVERKFVDRVDKHLPPLRIRIVQPSHSAWRLMIRVVSPAARLQNRSWPSPEITSKSSNIGCAAMPAFWKQ